MLPRKTRPGGVQILHPDRLPCAKIRASPVRLALPAAAAWFLARDASSRFLSIAKSGARPRSPRCRNGLLIFQNINPSTGI